MRLRVVARICSGLLFASIIDSCVQAQVIHQIKLAFDMSCGGDKDIISSSTLNERAADGCKYLYDPTSRQANRICHVFPCTSRTKDKKFVELYGGHNYLSEHGILYSIKLDKKEDPIQQKRKVIFSWNRLTNECSTKGAEYFNWFKLRHVTCDPLKNLFRSKN